MRRCRSPGRWRRRRSSSSRATICGPKQANKAGGITVGGKKYKVEIVYSDYQSNTPRAVQATEQMITQDNINFLFGAVRLGRRQGGKHDLREIQGADAGGDRIVGAGL